MEESLVGVGSRQNRRRNGECAWADGRARWTGPGEGRGTERGFGVPTTGETTAHLCAENKGAVEWERW